MQALPAWSLESVQLKVGHTNILHQLSNAMPAFRKQSLTAYISRLLVTVRGRPISQGRTTPHRLQHAQFCDKSPLCTRQRQAKIQNGVALLTRLVSVLLWLSYLAGVFQIWPQQAPTRASSHLERQSMCAWKSKTQACLRHTVVQHPSSWLHFVCPSACFQQIFCMPI